jgi:hypothetical protein
MRVGLYGKPGLFWAGIHDALPHGIIALGWRSRLVKEVG